MRFLLPLLLLAGCASDVQMEIIEQLSLGPCDVGEVIITGDVALGNTPIFSSTAHVNIRQERTFEMLAYDCFEGTPLEGQNE